MAHNNTIIPISKLRIPKSFFAQWDAMSEHDRIAYILGRIDVCDMNIEEIKRMIENMEEEYDYED